MLTYIQVDGCTLEQETIIRNHVVWWGYKNRADNISSSIPLNTLLGVFFVVYRKVSCHMTFLREATPTNGTLERLFTSMRSYMVFKVEFSRKRLSTHITSKLFLVSRGHCGGFFNEKFACKRRVKS